MVGEENLRVRREVVCFAPEEVEHAYTLNATILEHR